MGSTPFKAYSSLRGMPPCMSSQAQGYPRILDGGCDVINVLYDMDDANSLKIFCNGNA
jgi:hypothetical protein